MQIVILAGGSGSRLYPKTKTIPKSLISINQKPFLTHQINLLKKNNIFNIVLCLGTFSQQIMDYYGNGKNFGVSIKYSIEDPDNLLGTAGALKNAESYFDESFFVMYGDSYLPINFCKIWDEFHKTKTLGMMTVYKNNDEFDKSNVSIKDNFVTVYNKSSKNNDLDFIDYGLLLFHKKVLEIIPSNTFLNLDFLLQGLILKKQLSSYQIFQRFYEIGSFQGIEDFSNYIRS